MALGTGDPALKPCNRRSSQQEPAVEVPEFFLCPIHLEIMTDPVTLSTGMTYDRVSIKRWLATGHNTCPTTNQVLQSQDLIPNYTLSRAIQNWCMENKASEIHWLSTLRPPVEPDTMQSLLHSIDRSADSEHCDGESLKNLYTVAEGCRRNRKCLKEAGAVPMLANAVASTRINLDTRDGRKAAEYAVGVISLLKLDEDNRRSLSAPEPFALLCTILASGTSSARVNAAHVIHSVMGDDVRLKTTAGNHPGAMKGLMVLLREHRLRPRATKFALRCLLSLSLPKKNRIVAIDSLAIGALVELIPRTEKRNIEYAFAILEVLANCAEGREAITNHPTAIPRIVQSLLGVSNHAAEHAVATLWAVISLASNRSVINVALHSGAFTKLLMVLTSECSHRAKLKARQTLKLLDEVSGTQSAGPEVQSGVAIKSVACRRRLQLLGES